jgi:hypothetical protein
MTSCAPIDIMIDFRYRIGYVHWLRSWSIMMVRLSMMWDMDISSIVRHDRSWSCSILKARHHVCIRNGSTCIYPYVDVICAQIRRHSISNHHRFKTDTGLRKNTKTVRHDQSMDNWSTRYTETAQTRSEYLMFYFDLPCRFANREDF